MHDQFFEAIKELNVLSLEYFSFRSFPQTMELQKNLLTLNLKSCTDLESISIVGQLLNLQILRCCRCHSITELPAEIGGLIHLRLLEFSYCHCLKRIAAGVISSLVRLEELKMIGSFKGWEAEKNGKEGRNASLNELQSLSNLTCLEIQIGDCTLAAEDIRLSSKIVKYDIIFMGVNFVNTLEKGMHLELPREIRLGNWIHIFLRSTEYLDLKGDGSNSLDLAQVQNIKTFHFHCCSTVKKLVSTKSIDRRFGVFPVLESLTLENLPNLEEICDGPIQAGSNSFSNLKELKISFLSGIKYLWNSQNQNVSLSNLTSIDIWGCNKLRNLFPLKMAKDVLSQLEILACSMMEEVFSNDGEEGHITFPKLKKLSLASLPSLTNLCKGIENIEFPVLTEMQIHRCPKLTSFVSSTDTGNCLHLSCNQKVTFGSLKKLVIGGYENISNLWCHQIPSTGFFYKLERLDINSCGSIRCLFPSSIAANLVNLERLDIWSCNEMVKVIGDDEENVGENSPIFPSLQFMELDRLPNLVNFCGWRCALQLPSLADIVIWECPRMESFTMGSITTPNLKSIKIDSERKDVEDLNGAVQLYFRAKQRDQESAQIEKEQEESNKEVQEDGKHLKVETEEE
ncbi:hypothetical protein BUALT_Bualt12G0011700 [Buddleja alternifolia]|nr:hypothetical protein BUALT_BualtUnG0058800 [Buddleja alternifolia]KAG8371907.1 hypothetical protein BUALT_Bualt12G0011700 [Buddleja alternifolia]